MREVLSCMPVLLGNINQKKATFKTVRQSLLKRIMAKYYSDRQ